ncbi:hypothetical protein BgiBS90_026221 [Biomphalaria glabrata]|nr:hypothetical protein BgiBS90_026221 [Biomphalaria glabrata]
MNLPQQAVRTATGIVGSLPIIGGIARNSVGGTVANLPVDNLPSIPISALQSLFSGIPIAGGLGGTLLGTVQGFTDGSGAFSNSLGY